MMQKLAASIPMDYSFIPMPEKYKCRIPETNFPDGSILNGDTLYTALDEPLQKLGVDTQTSRVLRGGKGFLAGLVAQCATEFFQVPTKFLSGYTLFQTYVLTHAFNEAPIEAMLSSDA